jgi:hypothetical protein
MPDISSDSNWRRFPHKKLLLVLSVIAMLSLLAATALAAGDMTCEHSGATMDPIESLHHCVQHAHDMGHITNAGVANSLMAKLDAAQAAFDRGQTDVAINLLNAFINEAKAQSGKFIGVDHAGHLVMHAQMVRIRLTVFGLTRGTQLLPLASSSAIRRFPHAGA